MPCTTRGQWLETYSFEIDPDHDFHVAGKRADWASGHPFTWNSYPNSIEVPNDEGATLYSSYSMAVSSDDVLLAVSSGLKVYVYDIGSRELRQSFDGCGNIGFRPLDRRGEDFGETELGDGVQMDTEAHGGPRYTLICSVPSTERPYNSEGKDLVLWDLDKNGRLLDEDEPIDASALSAKAIAAIAADLAENHEWSPDFIAGSTLTADVEAALKKVETEHRIAHNIIIKDASLFGFSSNPFSPTGTRLLYLTHDESTPSNIPDVESKPWVAVWDLDSGKESFRMHGHTDHIMWAGFSPDNARIATVAWDGTMRMHDSQTGVLQWVTADSGGQCWSADFSPDSKHIVWSSKNGSLITVLDTESGNVRAKFPLKLNGWARSLAWHPDGKSIAIGSNTRSAYVWRPFEGEHAEVLEVKLKSDHSMASLSDVKWVDHAKLAVGCTDGSVVVWDRDTNAKEGFLRPQGLIPEGYTDLGLHFLAESETYVDLNHDGKIRFWRYAVPAFPSWWEKEEAKPVEKLYPPTGKYVNITKKATPKAAESTQSADLKQSSEPKKPAVEEWLEKGAELWTAE